MNLMGTNRDFGAQKAKYQSILGETKHFVGRNFRQDPAQAKRFRKARKKLKQTNQMEAMSKMEYVQRKGGGGLRPRKPTSPTLSNPRTQLG